MLPEFAKAKQKMLDLWNRSLFAGLKGSDPLLSEIPIRVQREGHTAFIGGGEMEYKIHSVTFALPMRDAEGMTADEFIGGAVRLGAQMAEKQIRGVFDKLSTPTAHSTPISWKGELTLDVLLEAWSKLEVRFDNEGKPIWPTGFMSSAAVAELNGKLPQWQQDPECCRKWEELINRKRKEFDEREARRRLVD